MTQSIAVIGSGMAGLAAAHHCRQAGYHVTIFEAQDHHGMDAHAMALDGGLVDVPLRVMSASAWQRVLSLAHKVGVDTFDVKTYVSCSWDDQTTWFRSGRIPVLGTPFVGSMKYLNGDALVMAKGLAQLHRITRHLSRFDSSLTLAALLGREPFDPRFWRGLVLPLLTTICTCDEKHLMAWPAAQLLSLLDTILHGGGLRRLKGGTSALVKGLSEGVPTYSGSPVTRVALTSGHSGQSAPSVMVSNEKGEGGRFDRVIVATQANQLDFLDQDAFAEERQVLSDIPFDDGVLWVHRDPRFMPLHKRDWTALNFQSDRGLEKPMFTVWVNAVEPSLLGKPPVFQTWNPLFEPAPETVLARVPLQRAVVNHRNQRVHEKLHAWHSDPKRRVFFCGAWAYEGVPLLESAARSGAAVVAALQRQEMPAT